MRRREFISLIGGVAVAWPLAARAEQADRTRRVGVLMGYAETDPQAKAMLAEFTRAVSEFGWIEGRNLRMDVRWAPGNTDLMRTFAKELVSLQPDVILTQSTPVTAAVKRDLDHPHCICGRCRPSWLRIRCEPVPAGRKRYGVRLAGSGVDGEQVA